MGSTQSGAAVDVAAIENSAKISVIATGRYRSELSLDLALRYARDVHGVLDARFPGIGMYRQYHVGSREPVRADLFPAVPGIVQERPVDRQLHGVSIILFGDDAAHQATANSRLLALAREDNLVLTELNFHYVETEHASKRTYLDRTGWNGTPQGPVRKPTFCSFFRRREGVAREAFDAYMRALAQRWSETDGVLRVRLELLSDPESQFDFRPDDLQHALIDLVIEDESVAQRLLREGDGLDHAGHVEGIQTLQIDSLFTIVFDDKPTDVGLRGWSAVQTIEEIGVVEAQNNPELLELMYGPVVRSTRNLM